MRCRNWRSRSADQGIWLVFMRVSISSGCAGFAQHTADARLRQVETHGDLLHAQPFLSIEAANLVALARREIADCPAAAHPRAAFHRAIACSAAASKNGSRGGSLLRRVA